MARYPEVATDRRVAPERLRRVVEDIFAACGMSAADAALMAEALVFADLRGIHSHGVLRVPDYVRKLTREGVNPRGRPRVLSRRGGAIVVDGDNSMGQIGGRFAMAEAIEAAAVHGIAFAALGGSNHCGALDWYTLAAADRGMIGIAGTNALPTMAPVGGADRIVGINPLSVAMPGGRSGGFLFDFAFGATAHGKIRVYAQKGLDIPEGWALDRAGNPTTDARAALEGLIQPIGGHKGVALGMAVGLLSTLLSGAAYGTELGSMETGPRPGRDGQFFVAIDIAAFVPLGSFTGRLDAVLEEMRSSRRRAGVERILVPGESEREFERDYAAAGIRLAAETVNGILSAAAEVGADAGPLVAPQGG